MNARAIVYYFIHSYEPFSAIILYEPATIERKPILSLRSDSALVEPLRACCRPLQRNWMSRTEQGNIRSGVSPFLRHNLSCFQARLDRFCQRNYPVYFCLEERWYSWRLANALLPRFHRTQTKSHKRRMFVVDGKITFSMVLAACWYLVKRCYWGRKRKKKHFHEENCYFLSFHLLPSLRPCCRCFFRLVALDELD